MEKILTILFLLIISIITYGQNDYYIKDSIGYYHSDLLDNVELSNSKFCTVKNGDKTIQYSPYQVEEYGFEDGRIYIAKDIKLADSVHRVFLQQLVKGKITLYYYRGTNIKTFYVSKDSSSLVELPYKKNKISFRDDLKYLTSDCPNVVDAVRLVTYSKPVLTKLISSYINCKLRPFPFVKFGFIVGYEAIKLIPASILPAIPVSQLDFKNNSGITVGLFIDNPILVSDFTLHTELYYSQHGFSYNKLILNNDVDFIANIASLKIPVLVRYTFPFNTIKPFINAGGIFNYNLKNTNAFYETTINQNSIELHGITSTSLINTYQIGLSIGGGIEFKLNYKNRLFLEVRYTNLYGDSDKLNTSELNFITGINI